MKLHSPAAERNAGPILEVLREWLPQDGTVLEIAAGSGQHAVAFARAFPGLTWQPTDPDAAAVASIGMWRNEGGTPNLLPPQRLDVHQANWGVELVDAVLAVNMVHIAPWSASLALLDGARRVLAVGGALVLYGPWIVEGEPTAPSNLAFDADLQQRNSEWGLRSVATFAAEAEPRGLVLVDQRTMPANNRMLLFRRSG